MGKVLFFTEWQRENASSFLIENYDRVGTYKNRYGKSLQRKFETRVDEAKGVIYLTRVS